MTAWVASIPGKACVNVFILATCAFVYGQSLATDRIGDAFAQQARHWHFNVLLDGKPIGWHEFTVTREANFQTVASHASFTVKKLLIPLYRYEHRDQEWWRGDCLQQIDSETRDNGTVAVVRGRSRQQGLEVRTPDGQSALEGCVWTYAYWDERLVAQKRLLNAQTGEYQPIEVTHRGPESVWLRGARVTAERYSLHGPKFTIELWYSLQGEWIALESTTERGGRLRYELR